MHRSTVPAALVLACALGSASAQTAAPGPDARPGGHATVGEPLENGANSFTESQVKERLAKMGFGEVRDLKKDDSGIWRGTAIHAGQEVRIGMDYKGNVAAQ